MEHNNFPNSPGLYIAQRDTEVILIKVTGMYPTLTLAKGFSISGLISGNQIKEAGKEVLSNMIVESGKWTFTCVDCIKVHNVFPKLSFKPDGRLDLAQDERLALRAKYYRLVQSGTPISTIVNSFVFEYNASHNTIVDLINEFNKESQYVISLYRIYRWITTCR